MKVWLVAIAMMLSVIGAYALAPDRLAVPGNTLSLEDMVPTQIGEWQLDDSVVPVLPRKAEDEESLEARVYDQTLVRTYRNGNDERIMLVIAYGRDQSDALQVHMPEICYASQGFAVERAGRTMVSAGGAVFPVVRLMTRRGRRYEPVTYWTRLGDRVASTMLSRQWAKLLYGLRGRIPDGVLIRVSSISSHPELAFAMQERFVHALLQSLDTRGRAFLLGEHNNV